MSDFLARENELLGGEFDGSGLQSSGNGGDEIDFDRAASAFPDISLDGDIPSVVSPPVAAQPTGGFSFDDFGSPPRERVTDIKVTGDDEIEKFEDQFPDIEVPGPPEPVTSAPTLGATPTFAPRPQPSAFANTPILTQQIDEEEPEVIKQWREAQAEQIKARDEASKQKRQETIAKAERSIDQFYEDYNSKKERNIRENKESESEYLASLSDSLSAGTTWQRICTLIELENSQSKTLARAGAGTSDLSRFKEVLLRLKREGDAAPGAAGY